MFIPSLESVQADSGIRNDKPDLLRRSIRNPAQQPGLLKLAERVADSGPGNRTTRFTRFVVEDFSIDAPIGIPAQQPCNGDPLSGRTQPDLAQEALQIVGQ